MEVELHVRVTLEPRSFLRFLQMVEDDVDGRVRVGADDDFHEVEKLDSARKPASPWKWNCTFG